MNAALFMVVAALLGAVPSLWGVLAVPAAALGGLAFAAPLTAYSAGHDSDMSFPIIMRVAVLPMFLFSGTFFPVDQLPDWLAAAGPRHAALARGRAVPGRHDRDALARRGRRPHRVPRSRLVGAGCWWGVAHLPAEAGAVSDRCAVVALAGTRRTLRVVERNARTYLRAWPVFLSGFVEPAFYLFSIGMGVGGLVGAGARTDGPVDYDQFVAPG